MSRQRAGCNAGTAKADGQRAWWQLPRGTWRVFKVLSVWSLANGRLESPNNRGLCAGKGQAATLEQQTLTARGQRAWCQLPRGIWKVFRVLSVWSLGLNALITEGYVQAKGRLQPWNSKRWRPEGLVAAAPRDLEGFKGFKRLKPGKRQAWMP